MDRRSFLQTTGLTAVAAMAARSAVAAPAVAERQEISRREKAAAPQRSQGVGHLGFVEALPERPGVGGSVRRVEEADRRLRRLPGQTGRKRRETGRVHQVRSRREPGGRPARHLRPSENLRRPGQQRLPADEGPISSRLPARPARRRASSGRRFWRFPRRRWTSFSNRRRWRPTSCC